MWMNKKFVYQVGNNKKVILWCTANQISRITNKVKYNTNNACLILKWSFLSFIWSLVLLKFRAPMNLTRYFTCGQEWVQSVHKQQVPFYLQLHFQHKWQNCLSQIIFKTQYTAILHVTQVQCQIKKKNNNNKQKKQILSTSSSSSSSWNGEYNT
jgi:hypothetical protein